MRLQWPLKGTLCAPNIGRVPRAIEHSSPTCCPETYLFLINLQSTEENDLGVILSSVCNFIVIACGTKTIVVRMRGNFKQL